MKRYPVVLSIAGSDCSGGAGIQADIKTISALGGYAASVITAVTVQNTLGVQAVHSIPPEIIHGQLEAVMEDLHPDAVKIGMVNDVATIRVIAECLRKYAPDFIVYDPVMISTSGQKLMTDDVIEVMKDELFPHIDLLTPNIHEATVLSGIETFDITDMRRAARRLTDKYEILVLIKGGHLRGNDMCDLFHNSEQYHRIYSEKKIESKNLHGTGCTLASAIATYYAKGFNVEDAINKAKAYVTKAIIEGKYLHIGHGNGPLWHFPDSAAQMCTFCAVVS